MHNHTSDGYTHHQCIYSYLETSLDCPICRKDISNVVMSSPRHMRKLFSFLINQKSAMFNSILERCPEVLTKFPEYCIELKHEATVEHLSKAPDGTLRNERVFVWLCGNGLLELVKRVADKRTANYASPFGKTKRLCSPLNAAIVGDHLGIVELLVASWGGRRQGAPEAGEGKAGHV